MKKERALEIIINSFKIYKKEYVNNEILFVYENHMGEIKGFECPFKEGNFKHLTGVESIHEGENFYKNLDRKTLSINDFEFDKKGTAIQKLDVIEMLGDILYKPYAIGYAIPNLLKNNSRKIDIATGNSKKLTLGFKDGTTSYPVTLLNMNPKDAISKYYPVLFTLRKKIEDEKYTEILFWKENTSKNKLRKIEKNYQLKINYPEVF